MNASKPERAGKRWVIPTLAVALAVLLIVMTVALCNPPEYVWQPQFDPRAIQGEPAETPDSYVRFSHESVSYGFLVCHSPAADGTELEVYFTNPAGNSATLKLRILDMDGTILGETGLVRAGEYVETVSLSSAPSLGTPIRMKVMGYDPETFESVGAVPWTDEVGG